MNWKIFPTGNAALNEFGLSTQVPSNYSYISSGRTISYKVDKNAVIFTHRSSRETDFSYITGTVIQMLKQIGQDNITDDTIKIISSRLSEKEKELILFESKRTSAWIFETIKKICKEPIK